MSSERALTGFNPWVLVYFTLRDIFYAVNIWSRLHVPYSILGFEIMLVPFCFFVFE